MADVIKVLGQLAPAATTTTTLYTAPNLNQTTVSSFNVCNRTSGALTFRLSIHVAGAGADNKSSFIMASQLRPRIHFWLY